MQFLVNDFLTHLKLVSTLRFVISSGISSGKDIIVLCYKKENNNANTSKCEICIIYKKKVEEKN